MRVECEQDMAVMKLHGVLIDMLLDIAPETCKKHITKDKKEMKQLHNRMAFEPKHKHELMKEECKKVLESLLFPVEKCNRTTKS